MPTFSTDGLSLFYDERVSDDLLLILPGNTATSACLQAELNRFGKSYSAVSLVFRGTGKSSRMASWPEDWWGRCTGVIADSTVEIYSPDNLRNKFADRSRRTREQAEFWRYAHGEDWEAVVEADSSLLLGQIPDCRAFLHGKVDHPLMCMCPDVFRTASDKFLNEVMWSR